MRNRPYRWLIIFLLGIWLVIAFVRSVIFGYRLVKESNQPLAQFFPNIKACANTFDHTDIQQVVLKAYRSLEVVCAK